VRGVGGLFFPVDLTLGLGTEGYSPTLLRRIEYAGGNLGSFDRGSQALLHLAELEISPRHVQRLTERLGHEREAVRNAEVAAHQAGKLPPRHPEPPSVVAVHMDAGKLQARADDGARGVREPHWRDAKVACMATYPDIRHAADPQPTPPPAFLDPPQVVRLCADLARVRNSPAPPSSQAQPTAPREVVPPNGDKSPQPRVRTAVATLGNTEKFGWVVSAEAQRRGFYAAPRRAVLGDGGNWIGPLADFHFPGWTQILDFLHLLAQLYAAACCAWPRPGTRRWRLYTRLIYAAWAGNVHEVLDLLHHHQRRLGAPPADAQEDDPRVRLALVIAYVQANRHRMDYARYRCEGLPISTALVESLIKQFNQRVKGTDKFWIEGGAEAVLQVRAAYVSQDDRALEHYGHRPLSRAARRGRLAKSA
jgi:hypothetical protein